MVDIKNIVEICRNILCAKAKYFYDQFYSDKSLDKNINAYVSEFKNYFEHDFIMEFNPEIEGLNISSETVLAIMKLIIYSQAYLSYVHKNFIDEDPDEISLMEMIENLSIKDKILFPINSSIIKEFIEFEIEINYFERHLAYEALLDKEVLSKYLSINPFGVLLASELVQNLTEEEKMTFNILMFYLEATSSIELDNQSLLCLFHDVIAESKYSEEIIYEYIIAEVYKYLIIKKYENNISDAENLVIDHIETNNIIDIIEEMKGDSKYREENQEDYDEFANYIIDLFYQININLQRNEAKAQNLKFAKTGKQEVYKRINPFLRG